MMTHVHRECLFIAERSTVGFTPMKISVIVLQKPKKDTSYNSDIPSLVIYPKDSIYYCRSVLLSMFISALFPIAMNENSPDVHQTMDKKNVLYFPKWNAIIEVLKENKIMKFSDKQMKLERIIPNEVT